MHTKIDVLLNFGRCTGFYDATYTYYIITIIRTVLYLYAKVIVSVDRNNVVKLRNA